VKPRRALLFQGDSPLSDAAQSINSGATHSSLECAPLDASKHKPQAKKTAELFGGQQGT